MTGPTITLGTICLDGHDAHEMARFFGGLLGWESTLTEPDWVLMRDPEGGVGLAFQAEEGYVAPVWPEEPGEQQKMVHLDVRVRPADPDADLDGDAGQASLDSAARAATALGGRLADHQPRADLRIVLDPRRPPLLPVPHLARSTAERAPDSSVTPPYRRFCTRMRVQKQSPGGVTRSTRLRGRMRR